MGAGEGNLKGVVAAHECRRIWLTFLVERQGMECKVDIWVDIDVSDVCAEPLGIEVGMHTWSNIRDDVVLLPPSQNAERLRKAGQRET